MVELELGGWTLGFIFETLTLAVETLLCILIPPPGHFLLLRLLLLSLTLGNLWGYSAVNPIFILRLPFLCIFTWCLTLMSYDKTCLPSSFLWPTLYGFEGSGLACRVMMLLSVFLFILTMPSLPLLLKINVLFPSVEKFRHSYWEVEGLGRHSRLSKNLYE